MTPGCVTWPLTPKSRVPPSLRWWRSLSLENASPPIASAVGTMAIVSRLLTVLGIPKAPACAGKGGLSRGSPRLPSSELRSAVSSPQMYAPAPVCTTTSTA